MCSCHCNPLARLQNAICIQSMSRKWGVLRTQDEGAKEFNDDLKRVRGDPKQHSKQHGGRCEQGSEPKLGGRAQAPNLVAKRWTGTDQSFSNRIITNIIIRSSEGAQRKEAEGPPAGTWAGDRSAGASHVKEAPRSFVQPLRL